MSGIFSKASSHYGNCPLESDPLENAFGKITNTVHNTDSLRH